MTADRPGWRRFALPSEIFVDANLILNGSCVICSFAFVLFVFAVQCDCKTTPGQRDDLYENMTRYWVQTKISGLMKHPRCNLTHMRSV